METWGTPDGLVGDADLIRIRPRHLRDPAGCPRRLAVEIRPGLSLAASADRAGRAPAGGGTPFPLGRVMRVLDLIEYEGVTVDAAFARTARSDDSGSDRLLEKWTRQSVENYLIAAAALEAGGLALDPARARAIAADPPDLPGELAVFGRWFEGDERRELRLLRHRSVKGRDAGEPEIALAALVLADGRKVLGSRRADRPYVLSRVQDDVARILVVEIGCEDGSFEIRFVGTPEAARRTFRKHSEELLPGLVSGTEYRPGRDCAGCMLVTACPGVARVPGLLGVPAAPRPRRTWSVTTSRDHDACHQLPVLKDFRLPGDRDCEYDETARRGLAVHEWLRIQHSRRPHRACRPDEIPAPADAWRAGGWEISGAQAELGVQMLGDHAFVCALHGLPDNAVVEPEFTATAYDPDANVVVVAKIDLAVLHDGFWTLRETKTTSTAAATDLFGKYPQLAVNLLLLDSGALPGGSRRGTAQIELLTASGPVLVSFSPDDPGVLNHARETVRQRVSAWRQDTRFSAVGHSLSCARCGMSRWCPDARPTSREEAA
jgi:hypothetical protein